MRVTPNHPPLPAVGHIDVHSHLLPRIDDGCATIDESIECIRQLMAAGFAGSVCTPHFCRETNSHITREAIDGALAGLSERVAEEGIDYRLWPGGEVRLARSTIPWFEEVGVPTLGAGRSVLVDFWGMTWSDYASDICRYLIERGYQVIVAHPERMNLVLPSRDEVIESLGAMGVTFQGNLNSLTGGEGAEAGDVSARLLAENRYDLLATDVHGPVGLARRIEGIAVAERLVGPKRLAALLDERPREILSAATHP